MSRKLFFYKGDDLQFGAKAFSLSKFVKNYKRPVIVYDKALIKERIQWIQNWKGLGRLHYAMKANFHPELLKIFKKNNCGLDVVSLGEMKHAMKLGFKPKDFIFSGVAKSEEELGWAIQKQIYQINIESLSELKKIIALARKKKKKASVALRVNPEIDAETHPSISTALKHSKFGLDFKVAEEAIALIAASKGVVELKALSFHLGSQIMNVQVFKKAMDVMIPFYRRAQKICPELDRLDLGGGLGIDYKDHDLDHDKQRWQDLQTLFTAELKGVKAFVLLEVGRFLVARSGVMLSRVEIIKQTSHDKNFLILDVGMSHLMRPALYDAYHDIKPLKIKRGEEKTYEVVGPICESTDVLGVDRNFFGVNEGDFIAICDVGAYGSAMASRYNLRDAANEIFV
jgi:diaminopimelate decarboxylase